MCPLSCLHQNFHRPKLAARRKVCVPHGHLHIGVSHEFQHSVEVKYMDKKRPIDGLSAPVRA
jgi:hypothetical protein